MAGRVERRPRAEDDLIDVWLYIAGDNEPAADRMLQRFEQAFTLLAGRPLVGRARPELLDDLRSFPVANYVIFYRPISDGIELIRVLSRYLDLNEQDLG